MASGVTPKQVYTALTQAGASTVQAVGIMANMIAESGINPESINRSDPNGGSFGLVQQNGASYSNLVTGNPAADMAAQIKVLARNGGFAAASGSTGAQAAGNFAANYERCQGCQPGGAQYSQRVANAATVEGWVSSGSWPASAGSSSSAAGSGSGSGATGSASNSTDPTCAWGFSGSLVVTSVNICVIRKATLRHVVGGLLLGAGGVVFIAGAAILAASAFSHTEAGRAVQQAAAAVPGTRQVRVAVRSAPPAQPRSRSRAAQQSQ